MTTSSSTIDRSPSHQLARERFSRKSMADKYPSEYSNRRRDRREKACILECLSSIPPGARILDLPCGAGRLTRILLDRGDHVTAADISEAMLRRARENYRKYCEQHSGQAPPMRFALCDVLSSGFEDNAFDGVTCIRLFHHFNDVQTRRRALSELRRVCRGQIIVTFLNSFALDRVTCWLKARIRGHKQLSQLPIPFTTFAADIAAAGLQIDRQIAAHWGISSRWFLVLSRRET